MSRSDSERFRRAVAVVEQLLDLPPDQRLARLEAECGGDAELAREVESLLAADEAAGGFLEQPAHVWAGAVAAAVRAGPEDLEPGAVVGPFQLTGVLGRGGMGVVYRAERATGGFRQQAALKLLKRGLDTDELVARFRRERQILAQLRHPNIAVLLDGGVATDGRPYFAMELVEGEPITDWCDAHHLSVTGRVRRFLDACAAVSHAHANLVVHCDLKPGHIVVDEEEHVRLLDFGIAKLLAEAGGEGTVTRLGGRPLTPAYAAPEQLRGEPVTTATDVYALGVVLYELVCGRHPFVADPDAAKRRAASGRAPPSLARALTRPAPDEVEAVEVAKRRGTSLGHLRRTLRGDIEAIVQTALATEPEARYSSAEALAEDLQRYLAGRPVRARRPTPSYRGLRFVARHRLGVAAAALVVLSLLAGAGGVVWQARATTREARRARAVIDFLVAVFREAAPARSPNGPRTTVKELLDRAAPRIDSDLRNEPELRAELHGVLGELYEVLGLYDRAAPLLEKALTESRAEYGERSPATVQALQRVGSLLTDRGKYREAEAVLRRALAVQDATGIDGGRERRETLRRLALAADLLARYDESIPLFRKALAISSGSEGPDSDAALADARSLGITLWKAGKNDEAEPLLRGTLERARARHGDDAVELTEIEKGLALLLADHNRFDEAVTLLADAVRIQRERLGPLHPNLAETLDDLAQTERLRGHFEGVGELFSEAIAIRRRALGPDSPQLAFSMNNYANYLFFQGDFSGAAKEFGEALGILRRSLGEEHPAVATCMGNLGVVLHRQGRLAEAEPLLRHSLELRRRSQSEPREEVMLGLTNLGLLHVAQGKLDQAERELGEAGTIAKATFPPAHPRRASVEAAQGRLRLAQGRLEEARVILEHALETFTVSVSPDDPRVAEVHLDLGRAFAAQGRLADARPHLETAVRLLAGKKGYRRQYDLASRWLRR